MHYKTAIVKSSQICVKFDTERSEYLKILGQLKSLYGADAEKDGDEWVWHVNDNDRNRSVLNNLGFIVEDPAEEDKDLSGVSSRLREYQRTGVRFFVKYDGSALLGDDMGLGKTCQSLSYVAHKDRYPLLIICPATLKLNWQDEYTMWCGDKESVAVLNGRKPYRVGAKVVIINYDILTYWESMLIRWSPTQIIADEVQKVKKTSGNVAKRTQAFMNICKNRDLIALSGTPIENRPYEFFNILNLLRPKIFKSSFQFGAQFCGAPSRNRYTGQVEYKGSKNLAELNALLRTVMLRRLKKDVLTELPAKTRVAVPMELDVKLRKEYYELEESIKNAREVNIANGIEVKNSVEALKQLAVKMKMVSVIKWIKDYLEGGEKLVVFGIHRAVIAELMQEFGKIAVKIDGSVTGAKRHEAVNRFQNDPSIRLLFGNLQAAGVGITLTTAPATAHIEFDWGPSSHIQGEDRIYRIGQEADAVFAYYLIAKGTIEESLLKMIDHKQRILDKILDGTPANDEFPLLELLNAVRFKRRSQVVGI